MVPVAVGCFRLDLLVTPFAEQVGAAGAAVAGAAGAAAVVDAAAVVVVVAADADAVAAAAAAVVAAAIDLEATQVAVCSDSLDSLETVPHS